MLRPPARLPACETRLGFDIDSNRKEMAMAIMQSSDEIAELSVEEVEELETKIVPQSSSSFMDRAMRPLK